MNFTPAKLREIADREHVPADAQEALYAAAKELDAALAAAEDRRRQYERDQMQMINLAIMPAANPWANPRAAPADLRDRNLGNSRGFASPQLFGGLGQRPR